MLSIYMQYRAPVNDTQQAANSVYMIISDQARLLSSSSLWAKGVIE